MDVNILVITLVLAFSLTLIALFVNGDGVQAALLSGMSALGGLIILYMDAGLLADGDITEISAGSSVVIASAASPATWAAISYLVLVFAAFPFMASIYRGYKAL